MSRLGFGGRPHFELALVIAARDGVGVGVAVGFGSGGMGSFVRIVAATIPFRRRPDDGCVSLSRPRLVYVVV